MDDIFVIIQCLDNLDEKMEPKEKVAEVNVIYVSALWRIFRF